MDTIHIQHDFINNLNIKNGVITLIIHSNVATTFRISYLNKNMFFLYCILIKSCHLRLAVWPLRTISQIISLNFIQIFFTFSHYFQLIWCSLILTWTWSSWDETTHNHRPNNVVRFQVWQKILLTSPELITCIVPWYKAHRSSNYIYPNVIS